MHGEPDIHKEGGRARWTTNYPSILSSSTPQQNIMRRVRFLDPETNEVHHPEPLKAQSSAAVPSLGTSTQPAGSHSLNQVLMPADAQRWDVRLPFGTYAQNWRRVATDRLAEPATFPSVAQLKIFSPQLPWAISVRPTTPGVFVSVFDVLAAVYASLRVGITQGEWERLSDAHKTLALRAKQDRILECEASRALDEGFHHPRRVDALGEVTRFAGLVPAPHRGPHAFNLEFVRR